MNVILKYTLISILIIILAFIPEGLVFRDQPSLCLFKNITDAECPLCGMTRAGYELIRLNPVASLNYNPGFVFLPLLLILEIVADFSYFKYIHKLRKVAWILFSLFLVILFIYRLIRYYSVV